MNLRWILTLGWLLWCLPFYGVLQNPQAAETTDKRARWGVLLQALACTGVALSDSTGFVPSLWRSVPSVIYLLLGGLLSWTSVGALGKQWRLDAGLNPDHQLVRRGAYRWVRHPIYASLFFMLWGTGLAVAPLSLVAIATLVMVIGTEIRVRIEDGLLEGRFGDAFRKYRDSVSAYIPWVR